VKIATGTLPIGRNAYARVSTVMNLYKFWFSRQGWKALWVALRRSHRDPNARGQLIRLILTLLLVTAYPAWYLYQLRGFSLNFGWQGNLVIYTALGCVALLGVGSSVYYRLERRAQERSDPSVTAGIKLAIFREAVLLATLLERLSSEFGMEKELPASIEVITRRVLLDRINRFNLRDDLDPALRDVLLMPDGHWPADLKNKAFPAWECFYCLRWALGLGELRGLTANPGYSTTDARALAEFKRPEKLAVLPSWDIRPARDAASLFFHRCWSELMACNAVEGISAEDIDRAVDARENIQAEGYTADYLIGARTVPEWPDALLWQATVRAYHRMRALALLVDVTGSEKPASEFRAMIAEFFAFSHAERELAATERAAGAKPELTTES